MSETITEHDPALPEAHMHLVPPTEPVVGRLVESYLCTKGKSASFVRHVSIDVSGTPLAGKFLVGQSFGVIAPGVNAFGKPHKVRLYSIASPSWGEDGSGNVLSTTVKRVLDEYRAQTPRDDQEAHQLFLGVCSNFLCDIKIGAQVPVSGPNGKRFLLPSNPNDHDYIFIATGTGIAPFRGMAMELLENPAGPCRSQIHLLMGTPYTTDLMYDDLFRKMEREHPNFHYHVAISRESPNKVGSECRGLYVDRLFENSLTTFEPLLRNPRTLMYMCGLAGMQVGLFRVLARRGMGDGFISVKPEIESIDPAQWTDDHIKRHVRATRRCMLEVY
jgi:ferredoxin--NADP+ reductase